MRPGREIDARVAQEIFGFSVFAKNKVLHEEAEKGIRPLRPYTKEMQWAWEVAERMRISLIPIENGNWFAFSGPLAGWASPEAFLEYLRTGNFALCGAAVGENPAQAICEAALVARQKQKLSQEESTLAENSSSEGSDVATPLSSESEPGSAAEFQPQSKSELH